MSPLARRLLIAATLSTLAVGVWLRWALAGQLSLPAPFPYLRHAHSHMGYFGMLFPLAWIGWKAAGAKLPGTRWLALYALSTALSFVGFTLQGYGPVAIAGSTLVAVVWLVSAWPLLPRLRDLKDPLATIPPGLVFSLACVPPVAIYLRRDPDLAHGFVATFLSSLLFLVIIPSALAGRRISTGPWPALAISGALGAIALGVAPHSITQAGLFAYATLLFAPVLSRNLRPPTRASWLLVALGFAALAMGLVPNNRPSALGAIHFLILGPVLATLSTLWLRVRIPDVMWWLGHALWGVMSLSLVAQGLGAGRWTWTGAAVGGTATALWWCTILIWNARTPVPESPLS